MTAINTADNLKFGAEQVSKVYLGSTVVWTPPQHPYVGAVLADTPLAYYRLGEASGTVANDSSGNGRHGTYAGTPAFAQAGALTGLPSDTAVRFSGDDTVTIPTSVVIPVGSGITVEWWSYVASGDVTDSVCFSIGGQNDPNASQGHVPWSDQTLYWDHGSLGSGGRVSTSYSARINNWTLIHLTYDQVTNKHAISFNGVEVANTTNSNRPGTILYGGMIGGHPGGYRHRGVIDEFAVYDKALTVARRLAHYNARSV